MEEDVVAVKEVPGLWDAASKWVFALGWVPVQKWAAVLGVLVLEEGVA